MTDIIINNIIENFKEVIDENKKIIGKYYTIIKKYPDNRFITIFTGRLKEIEIHRSLSRYDQTIKHYSFDDFIYYFKNGKEIKLLNSYYENPFYEKYPCFFPEVIHSGLISSKFYEIQKINDKMKQELILSVIKQEFFKKTGISEDIFNYVIKGFLL